MRGDELAWTVTRFVIDRRITAIETGSIVKARITRVPCEPEAQLPRLALLSQERVETGGRKHGFAALMDSSQFHAQLVNAFLRKGPIHHALARELRQGPAHAPMLVHALRWTVPLGFTVVSQTRIDAAAVTNKHATDIHPSGFSLVTCDEPQTDCAQDSVVS